MRNNQCFVDTGAFIALNDSSDQHFHDAVEIASQLGGCTFVVSDAIINETYTLLRYRLGFHPASRFLNMVLANDDYQIVNVSHEMRMETFRLLEKYNDQKVSYCDALSVTIMQKMKINRIFAFDRHFDILGVNRIFLMKKDDGHLLAEKPTGKAGGFR
ncbi:MAG TPA: PIN domain-containing protein [Bacillales bacterium]|nr:PIN domain-containing protein [Bacillales bacterium]